MEQKQFERTLQELAPQQRKVLELFLAGQDDKQIAVSLHIAESTVRQNIRNILIRFKLKNDSEGDRKSQRPSLMALFAQHKPELVGKTATVEGSNLSKADAIIQDDVVVSDASFVGREQAIGDLDELIKEGAKCILIQGIGGMGKTVLAERYLAQRFHKPPLRFDIGKEARSISSAETLIEQKLQELGEEPGREFLVSCDCLRKKLQSQAIGILVDNLEPALNERGEFISEHRNYLELLRVLCDSSVRSITLVTSRERICENLNIAFYRLEPLSLDAWKDYFRQKDLSTDASALTEMHQTYSGNALAMKVLRERIAIDFQKNVEAYWQSRQTEEGVLFEQAIENLIAQQFNRLEKVYPLAYQLLCRIGCFRYQDILTVPREGLLHLLKDVSLKEAKEGMKAIEALCKLALVEQVEREYKLHPLIREEAIARLKKHEAWEQANCSAAGFWIDSVSVVKTLREAKLLLEAGYHYISVDDYQQAAELILSYEFKSSGMALVTQLRNFGCIAELIEILEFLLKKSLHLVKGKGYILPSLYAYLGDVCTISGKLKDGIENYKESMKLWSQIDMESWFEAKSLGLVCRDCEAIQHKQDDFCIDVQGALGLLYIKSFNFEEAISIFENVIPDMCKINLKAYFSYVYSCLAFVYISMNDRCESQKYRDLAVTSLQYLESSSRFTWAKTYGFYYLSKCFTICGLLESSKEILNKLYIFSMENSFLWARGLFFQGIGEIHNEKGEFQLAIDRYRESIEIFYKIGARCDLAEVYYQLGLTCQAKGDIPCSQDNFDKALKLWEKIEAPNQIKRVQRSIQENEF